MGRRRKRKEDEEAVDEGVSPHGEEVQEEKEHEVDQEQDHKTHQKEVAPFSADSEGAKYRLIFRVGQKFRGHYYNEGDIIEVSTGIYNAYKGRSTLKFEQLILKPQVL